MASLKTLAAAAGAAANTSLIDTERYIRIKEDAWSLEWIADNYSDDKERAAGRIYLPEGQRNWAWKNKKGLLKMQKLIDSLMHNYPIPSSIVNEVKGRYQVYDGRHRMETIALFRNNKFKWEGRFYKDLCETDREKFDNRKIPVTIVYAPRGVEAVSTQQLADIFIRLNSGQALTDSDMLWAYRDTEVMKGVRALILENRRLSAVFGNIDLNYRADLANWTAYYCGLGTNTAGNFTTSYIRISELGLDSKFDAEAVTRGVEALCQLYETANTKYPANTKELRAFKKIGHLNAFFLADWMRAAPASKSFVIAKWVSIIGRIRSGELGMRYALHTTGAQNLTTTKIELVLKQVNDYLTKGEVEEADDSDDDESV